MIKKNKTDILGVQFDNTTINGAVKFILSRMEKSQKTRVYTPNPEIVMAALKDHEFMKVLNRGELVLPDGIGVVIASKILKGGIKERVAGFDTTMTLLSEIKDKDYKVFFLGAAPGVAEKAKKNIEKKFKGINIVGVHDGYFKSDDEVIPLINESSADVLLVGLGAPKQEKFIDRNFEGLCAKTFIGCGGSLDVMAGVVKRAPDIYIKLHLEWFYRLVKQPSRFLRTLQLPLFLFKVLARRIKGTNR